VEKKIKVTAIPHAQQQMPQASSPDKILI